MQKTRKIWLFVLLTFALGCDERVAESEDLPEAETPSTSIPPVEEPSTPLAFPEIEGEETGEIGESEGGEGESEEGGTGESSDEGGVNFDCVDASDCSAVPLGLCQDVMCDGGVCVLLYLSETPCDDGDPCTAADVCTQGVCGGAGSCDCTRDADCALVVGGCTLGLCNENNVCELSELSGIPCDDGNLCTENDACDVGLCLGTPIDGCECDVSGIALNGLEGYCTLEEALVASASGDTIALAIGTYSLGDAVLAHDLNLVGAGIGDTVIEGTGSGPTLLVEAGKLHAEELTWNGGNVGIAMTGETAELDLRQVTFSSYDVVAVQLIAGAATLTNVNIVGDETGQAVGISIMDGATLEVYGGQVRNNGSFGIQNMGGTVLLENGLQVSLNGAAGVHSEGGSLSCGDVSVKSNQGYGVFVIGGLFTCENTIVNENLGVPGVGFWLDNGTGSLVDVSVNQNSGDGIYAADSLVEILTTEASGQGVEVVSNGGTGVALEGSGTLTITGGTFGFNGTGNIRVSGGTLFLTDALVENALSATEGHGVSLLLGIGESVLSGNTIQHNGGDGILVDGSVATINNNLGIRFNGGIGVHAVGGSTVSVLDNSALMQNVDAGVLLVGSTGSVQGNGIFETKLGASGFGDGIRIENGEEIEISGNFISAVEGSGIHILQSDKMTLKGNDISSCGTGGIYLVEALSYLSEGNTLSQNTAVGFFSEQSEGDVIETNVYGTLTSLAEEAVGGWGFAEDGFGFYFVNTVEDPSLGETFFTGNIAQDCVGTGVLVSGASLLMTGNSSVSNEGSGFSFLGLAKYSLIQNTSTGNGVFGYRCLSEYDPLSCVLNVGTGNVIGDFQECPELCDVENLGL